MLHIDTRLNLGGSGGALLNLRGELIGLTAACVLMDFAESPTGLA